MGLSTLFVLAGALTAPAVPLELLPPPTGEFIVVETNLGSFRIQLDKKKAPGTVKNFLGYVDDKFYDGTIFHRVIPGFMIQGGGFEAGMTEQKTRPPIKNEAANGLSNVRGTISMARTADPDSGTCQFFINVVDNSKTLDARDGNAGYCVFGAVVAGMDVVDKIRAVQTGQQGAFQDVPVQNVVIKSIRRVP